MSRLTRKNLVVDSEKLTELARIRGTSESEAMRQAVDHALAAEEVMVATRELRALGGLDDVIGTLPDWRAYAAAFRRRCLSTAS